jgi:hypothetical protein
MAVKSNHSLVVNVLTNNEIDVSINLRFTKLKLGKNKPLINLNVKITPRMPMKF